jgi:8-oxo-dGTP pyrophosphatase MutT (NUDIX family)
MLNQHNEWVDWLPNVKVLQKVIIQNNEGKYLALKRSETKPGNRQGKWDFVGGAMSEEDFENKTEDLNRDSLYREVREEIQLEITQPEIIYVKTFKKITKSVGSVLTLILIYTSRIKGENQTPVVSDEHSEYKWCTKNELISLDYGNSVVFKEAAEKL